jgi:hypothetical protein
MSGCFDFWLELPVFVGKSDLINQIWLNDFNVVVLVQPYTTFFYGWIRRRFSGDAGLNIDNVSFGESSRMGLGLFRVILTCMGHDAVRFMLGDRFLIGD